MAKSGSVSFSKRIDGVIKELCGKQELTDKDLLREASKLYKVLYNEVLERIKSDTGSNNAGEDVKEILLD
jgi:hypothetical protein